MSDIRSKPQTKEFDEGYDRTFGPDRKPQRGRWVWDEAQQKLVAVEDYRPPDRAVDAPIMVDRFYEGTTTMHADESGKIRQVDIGSRAKHRAYMKAHDLAPAGDYSPEWYAKKKAAEAEASRKASRAAVERAFYEISEGRKR